jgi:hypothetical protein
MHGCFMSIGEEVIIMKKKIFSALVITGLLLIMALFIPAQSNAGVNISINIPLPGLAVSAPPALVMVPGTYVYFAPDLDADVFFYDGYWYRPYAGYWYISADYRGPWGSVAVERMPLVLLNLSPSYRSVPPGYGRMPYGRVMLNGRAREGERYGKRYERNRGYDDYGRESRGHGRGHDRGGHGDD